MRYEVVAGGRTVRVEVGPDGRMLVDGRVIAYEARELIAGRQWSIALEGTSREVTILDRDPDGSRPMRVQVGDRETLVLAQDERTIAARRERAAAGGGRREVRSPMAGLLKALHVREGDLVEPGAALATLEAMKMENELRAPARGRVGRIAVDAGSKVESGALIVVLADEA